MRGRDSSRQPAATCRALRRAGSCLCATALAAIAVSGVAQARSRPHTTPAPPAPAIPGWVKPGLVEIYGQDVELGDIGVLSTTTVQSAGGGVVHATTVTKTLGLPQTKAYVWSCTAAGRCGLDAGFQFWVDAADPLASVTGQGVPLAYEGTATVADPINHHSYLVGILHYQNPTDTFRETIEYQKSTGLVIEHSELEGIVVVVIWYYQTGPPTAGVGGA